MDRPTSRAPTALIGLLAAVASTTPAAGQNPAHTHIRHAAESFRGTPDGMGLLPTALAEAEIAARHAGLASSEGNDLAAMQRHAGHVLHALDPSTVEGGGPGLGYGVVPAAEKTAHWIELAMAADGAGDAIATHGPHVAAAARSAAAFAEEAVSTAKLVLESESDAEAAGHCHELATLTDRMMNGYDADGDGRIGWQEGEGGLAQARQHLDLLMRGEGLGG